MLAADALGEAGMLGGIGSVGRCVAAQIGSEAGHDRMLSAGPEREREARPDSE